MLPATREVPRRLVHPKKRTIGLRVPDSPIAHALLVETGEPLLATTMRLPGDDVAMTDPFEIRAQLEHVVDLVIDGGPGGPTPTTVVDLTGDVPSVVRSGLGQFHDAAD